MFDEGDLDESETDPLILAYVAAYSRFIRDTGFRPLAAERIIHSQRWGYAGRLDRYGLIGGDTVILDFKTGVPPPCAVLQVAGYAIAFQEQTGIAIQRRIVLRLKPNGSYAVTERRDPEDLLVWLACVRVFKWRNGK